jgi:uncharacterized protein
MKPSSIDKDIALSSFRASLHQIYGDQLNKIILFGSRARGDANVKSDYDIAVFLKSMPDRWLELDRLADLRLKFLDQTGLFFDAKPYLNSAYRNSTPLMFEIRKEGVEIYSADHIN